MWTVVPRYPGRYVRLRGPVSPKMVASAPRRSAAHRRIRPVTGLDFDRFDALTFDCYGTLIDWEAGILAGLRPVLERRGVEVGDDELLEVYAASESAAEAGPYARYRDILGRCLREVGAHYGVEPDAAEVEAFGGRSPTGRPFPIRRRRSRRSIAGSASASSPTATTTCSPGPRRVSRRRSTGSSRPSRSAPTSRIRAVSGSRSSGSGCRANGSCTWHRACSTTMSRRRRSASAPSGSIAGTTGRGSVPRRPPTSYPTQHSPTWPRSLRPLRVGPPRARASRRSRRP